MKRGLFIALTAGIMLSTTAAAHDKSQRNDKQQHPTAEQLARHKTDKQTKELSLNESQAEELYKANLKNIEAHRKMHEERRQFEQQQRADMQKHNEKLRNSAGKILTPEQYAKWETAEKSRESKPQVEQSRRHGYQGRPMGCRGRCSSGKHDPKHDKHDRRHGNRTDESPR